MDNRIYADWAATAPLCTEAAAAMAPFQQGGAGNIAVNANANSLHSEGRAAFAAMEAARDEVARTIGARPDELFFTSGATESDNTAVWGIMSAVGAERRKGNPDFVPHLITTSIEHDAIIQPAHALPAYGAQVTFIDPDANGYIDPQKVRDALQPNTVLVSVMLANNEVGTIEPVAEIAQGAHEAGAFMHTDAVQAFGKIPVNVRDLGVDALSVSGHKICGPKGIGALYLKKGTPCVPFLRGGGQESGFRSGTQNVPGMVGFAAAAKAACGTPEAILAEASRQRALRDELYRGLLAHEGVVQSVPCAQGSVDFLPNIANVCVRGLESETMILRFDREGVALSGGSACSSHSLEPSRVLTRIGIPRDLALCSLRISIGRYTTEDDVRGVLAAFDRVVNWG
ncbi:cysteine desulfurase family protein [Hugonella massiliensis]|uniref:cysteine desulfurase family protein n=1 Tax=Hugonella massiliensis TaxID=1720315 RepID=UPI00073E70FE|nr:cysteine desulfurase family protein [Hugonella massiliensis]